MKLPNAVYDVLNYLCIIALPAIGTFVAAVGSDLGISDPDKVVKIIVAATALLGALLVINKAQYNRDQDRFNGTVQLANVGDPNRPTMANIEMKAEPSTFEHQKEITLKVENTGHTIDPHIPQPPTEMTLEDEQAAIHEGFAGEE